MPVDGKTGSLEQSFEQLYMLFRANYYRHLVGRIGARKGSLTATESFSVEIIYLLGRPTISQFAHYLGISVPNATYKVNCLVEKGYVEKEPSTQDKRESRLVVTHKFLRYYGLQDVSNAQLMRSIRENFSPAEVSALQTTIDKIVGLMKQPMGEDTRDD